MFRRFLMVLFCVVMFLSGVGSVSAERFRQGRMPGIALCTEQPDAPVCEVKVDWDIEHIRRSLARKESLIWGTEDTLTIVYAGQADSVFLNGGIQSMLYALTPEQDLWGIAVRVHDLPQAVIGYSFVPITAGVPDFDAQEFAVWRGPDAPPAPVYAESLSGELQTRTFDSDILGASREITVYLPPDHDQFSAVPVLYMADGQVLEKMAPIVDPLIVDGSVPPVVIVGIHASRTSKNAQDDPRAAEYLIAIGDPRFYVHETFLLDEVIPWAEETFGVTSDPDQRAIFGFSNGASFAIAMSLRHPDLFGGVIAFSVAWLPFDVPGMVVDPLARYYLQAGTLEPFIDNTQDWFDHLSELGAETSFFARVGGHDSTIWGEELPKALAWVFAR